MLDNLIHVIQVALTPVFLLSAIGSLLSVLSTRLGWVSDRVDLLAQQIASADPREASRLAGQLASLRRRSMLLDAAAVLAAVGAGATCLAALVLFVGALREAMTDIALFAAFGCALACTVLAVATFVAELLLAGRGLREEVAVRETEAVSQVVTAADRERMRPPSPPRF